MLSYLPVLLFVLVGLGFAAVTIGLSTFIVPRYKNTVKDSPYECGVEPVGNARSRFSVKFYLVAVLFILFDVEIIFFYPWAVNFRALGMFGFIEMLVFVGILLVGYIYVWRKGAFEWD